MTKLHDWSEVAPDRLNERAVRKAVHTSAMTVAHLELARGALVPRHHHPNEQVSYVRSGRLRFDFDGESIEVAAGQMLEIAPGRPHAVEALEDTVVLDLFAPPREDWIRGDDAYLRGR